MMVEEKMKGLRQGFRSIRKLTIQCLETFHVSIIVVVSLVTTILGFNVREAVKQKHKKDLHECKDHWELFGYLNIYWNYLSYNVFTTLCKHHPVAASHLPISRIHAYVEDVKRFEKNTTLVQFSSMPHTTRQLPPGFKRMITEHQWPSTVLLYDLDMFRKNFLHIFNLQEYTMMMDQVTSTESFRVMWFTILPDTVIEQLKLSRGRIKVLKDFRVSLLVVDGYIVYGTDVSVALTL